MKVSSSSKGFTLLETLVAIVIVTLVLVMALGYSSVIEKNTSLTRNVSTKNRVLSGIREFAAMPATLRASMRAANNGVAINPALLACAGGNPAKSCQNGVEFPFTMFAPILARDAGGNILGVQPISAPLNGPTPLRIDTFGSPCKGTSNQCPFLIYTSMKARCGPPARSPSDPSPTRAELVPQAACTVAEVIEVTFYVLLDPAVVTSDSLLAAFIKPASGSVAIPVHLISGNVPQ